MFKKPLRDAQMSEAVYVDQAAEWARTLIARETRGAGDTENAMRRLEARYGVSYNFLWALRYRKPKGVLTSLYFRLRDAYQAECDRQMRLLAHEIQITKAITGPDNAAVSAAQAVVGEEKT